MKSRPARQKPPALLTSGEVAEMFRVDPATVTRWENTGKLTAIRTLGGHRRFRADEIDALLKGAPPEIAADQDKSGPGDATPEPQNSEPPCEEGNR